MIFKWPISISITQQANQDFSKIYKLFGYQRQSVPPKYEFQKADFERKFMNDWVRFMGIATKTYNDYQYLKDNFYQMLFDARLIDKQDRLTMTQFKSRVEEFAKYIKEFFVIQQQMNEMRSILTSIKQLQTNTLVNTQNWIKKSSLVQKDKQLMKELVTIKQNLNEFLEAQMIQPLRNVNIAIIRSPKKEQGFFQQLSPEKQLKQRQKLQRQYDDNRKRLKLIIDSLSYLLPMDISEFQKFNDSILNQQKLQSNDKKLLIEIASIRLKYLELQQKLPRHLFRGQYQDKKPIGSNNRQSSQKMQLGQKPNQKVERSQKEILYKGQDYSEMKIVANQMGKQNALLKRRLEQNQRQLQGLRGTNNRLNQELLQIRNKCQNMKEISINRRQDPSNMIEQSKLALMKEEFEQRLNNMRINERKLKNSYIALEKVHQDVRAEIAILSSQLDQCKSDLSTKSKMVDQFQHIQHDYNNLRQEYQLLLGKQQNCISKSSLVPMQKDMAFSSQQIKDLQMNKLRQELNMKNITLSTLSHKFQEAITTKQQKITALELSLQQLRIKLTKNEEGLLHPSK